MCPRQRALLRRPTRPFPARPAAQEEARDAFKELLAGAGVSGEDTFDGALPRLISDPRYNALPTAGERKAVFNEYVQVGC